MPLWVFQDINNLNILKMKFLKSLFAVFAVMLLISACSSFGKNTSQLIYEKYYDMDGFSQIVFPPQFVLKFIPEENDDQIDVIKNMDDIRILFYNDENDNKMSDNHFDRVNKTLVQDGFEDMMVINENKSKVIIKIKKKNEMVRELFVLTSSEDNFAMLIISGKVDLNKISKVAKDFDFSEMKELESFSPFK